MKSLMKKGVIQFALLCLFAFSHAAQADLYAMVYSETNLNVSYVWDDATDEISDVMTLLTPTPTLSAYEITTEPLFLGDDIYGAFTNPIGSFTFEGSLSDAYFDSINDVYVHEYFTNVFDLNDDYVRDFTTVFIGAPVSAVPVPTALPLMASALGLFGIARRRTACSF